MFIAQLGVVIGDGDERLARLAPFLCHLEQVGSPGIAFKGLVLLVCPTAIKPNYDTKARERFRFSLNNLPEKASQKGLGGVQLFFGLLNEGDSLLLVVTHDSEHAQNRLNDLSVLPRKSLSSRKNLWRKPRDGTGLYQKWPCSTRCVRYCSTGCCCATLSGLRR